MVISFIFAVFNVKTTRFYYRIFFNRLLTFRLIYIIRISLGKAP